jgi:hypothetical protein
VLIARPLAFLIVKFAPGGLLETVTGYCDLLTILQQAVTQRQAPPSVIRTKELLIVERKECGGFG